MSGALDPKSLTRFRADPSKVRVSVRPSGSSFRVRVQSLMDNSLPIEAWAHDPEKALMNAIESADEYMPGIDLDMQWAYPHPMGASAVK